MVKIIKFSDLYKEELYNFIFSIMIVDLKKEPDSLRKELIDLNSIEVYYKGNFWIAIDKGKIVGSIGLLTEGTIGEIKRVYISSNYRRKGIGTLLYNQLESAVKNVEIKELQLNAGVNLKSAHKFYEKMGFTRCGISDNGNSYRYRKEL